MSTSNANVTPIHAESKKPARVENLDTIERAFLTAFDRCRDLEEETLEVESHDDNARQAKEGVEALHRSLARLTEIWSSGEVASKLAAAVEEADKLAKVRMADVSSDAWRWRTETWRKGARAATTYSSARTSYLRAVAQAFGGTIPEVVRGEIEWRDEAVRKLMDECQVFPLPGWARNEE